MSRPPSGFEPVDHTADAGLRGWGRDASELFAAMAAGLFDIIAGAASVRPRERREVVLRADSLAELLHDWLEALNTLHQVRGELYSRFHPRVQETGGIEDPTALTALVEGEAMDPGRHELRVEVKAVTWHELSVRRTPDGYEAYVLFDI